MVNLHSSSDASNALHNVDHAFIQYLLESNAAFAKEITRYGKGYPCVINARVRA